MDERYIKELKGGEAMYQAVLYEKDKKTISQMEFFFKEHTRNFNLTVITEETELLNTVNQKEIYELIIIGVSLNNNSDMEIAKSIREHNPKSYLVFLSNLECFYYETFEVEPFRFFKKPIDWKKFFTMMQIISQRLNHNNQYFYFKKDNIIYKIPFDEILYFESKRRLVNIVTVNGAYTYYDRLDLVENHIVNKCDTFIRIHKSFLVNSKHIIQFEYCKVHMSDDHILPISENKRVPIREMYLQFIGGDVCGRTIS